jgi:hypothetical protein
MSLVKVSGNASGTGTLTIAAPNTNSDYTLTLPQATTTFVGTDATQTLTNKTLSTGLVMGVSAITSGTAVASTSGTSIDFTSIPSWVKRITVMFSGVSTSGTSLPQVQIGSGSVTTSGYVATSSILFTAVSVTTATSGFIINSNQAAAVNNGQMVLTNVSGNVWVASGYFGNSSGTVTMSISTGALTLSGALDRVRITTVNGTDTFDAGSINILYE